MRKIAWLVMLVGALLGAEARTQDRAPEAASGFAQKSSVSSRHFMVSAGNEHAVKAGYDILRRGGSAVDAAIAVQLVLGLVEPQASGIGGGAFMLYHDAKTNRAVAIDGRETAPAAATPDRFLDPGGRPVGFYDAVVGGRSVAVPGVVALLQAAHARYGRLAWRDLFAPAIALAQGGFAVSPRLHALLAQDRYFRQPRARAYFYDASGAPLAVGTVLRNPAYARTLRMIATGGVDAFYRGPVAEDIVRTVADATPPGDLALSDLAGYRVKWRTPVCDTYRGYRVCGMPPPSSGGITVLQVLKLIEPYDIGSMGPASFWSVHFLSEAERLAYADRDAYEADPDFSRVPDGLLDDAYLKERSQSIRTSSSLVRAAPGNPPVRSPSGRASPSGASRALDLPSTSHIAIVDRDGNALSMTTTIENAFGSRLMTEGGFLLNNELTDFAFEPTANGRPVANRVEAGKRPRSAMSPTIVYDATGRVAIVAGSTGGSGIIHYVAKTLVGIIDWKLDPQAAASLPNFGSRNGPTELEAGTPVVDLEPRLRALGHETVVGEQTSGTQVIVRTPYGFVGGADPRKEGVVMGD